MKKKKTDKQHFICAGVSAGRLPKTDDIDGLLFSTASDCKNPGAVQKTKETIGVAKPKYKLNDSGGFQIHLREKKGGVMTFDPERPLKITKKCFNLAPRHVPETAIEMNANSMIALDYPIRKLKDPVEQDREFQKKLKYNVPWAIETAKLRKKLCPNIDLLIPVQAYNLQQFEEFYNQIKGIDFDGFSLPVRNMAMLDIATFLLKMHKFGVKKVHILGSSSLPVISVCAYMSQQFFDWVSFDSCTWRISAQYGRFIHPYDLSNKNLNKAGSYDPQYSCHCKSCQGRNLGQIAAMERKERMEVLVTHNYLAIQNLSREFGETTANAAYLEKRLSGSKRRDIKRILKCMSEIEAMCLMNIDIAA
jgi:hypothetical protein